MIDHIDPAREQQAIERHVGNLMHYSTRQERAAYLDELAKHDSADFVERVKEAFKREWEKR